MKSNTAVNWILKNSKEQRANLIFLVLANAFFSVLTVAFAYAIKIVIDGASSSNRKEFFVGVIAVCVIIALQFVFRLVNQGLSEKIKGRLEIAYKTQAFSTIQKIKYEKISAYHSGELMNRLTADVNVVSEGVATIFPTIVSSVVRLICAVAVLVYINWAFALAFIVCGATVFIIVGALRGKLKSLHKRTQETEGKSRSFMQECIENILAIKVFSVTEKTQKISSSLQEENFKVKMKRRNYTILGNASYNLIFSLGYVFALVFGGIMLTRGIGFGDLTAILQLVNSVQVPFASLSGVIPKIYSTTASAERLAEIELLECDNETARANSSELNKKFRSINICNLSFSYGRESVYKNADLVIKKGESVAITGVSGIGKSTIMKLLLGVYKVNEGEIYFDCENEKVFAGDYTRSMFSYVPQGNMLFSGSIRENVAFINSSATEEEIEFALKVSCAKDFINELPDKLDTIVGENGVGLSEGQVQRIALARAVLTKSPVMLLDEATGSLDEQTEREVVKNLLELKDTTLIIVSHRKAVAEMCERQIKVENKRFA